MKSFHDIGIDKITSGKKAFVNFTERLLLDGVATILPSKFLVVEILESVLPTPEVLGACRELRERGYLIALDDFILSPEYMPLISIADIIKIDFISTDLSAIERFTTAIRNKPITLLAEKIETYDVFETAKRLGFTLFQGYFFSKPMIIQSKGVLSPMKTTCMRLIHLSFDPDVNFHKISGIIKQDTALSFLLLRVVNSAFFGMRYKITGIRQALTILGMAELKKWVTMISMSRLGDNKPDELITTALVRARFLELIAPRVGIRNDVENMFMVGLMSLMDAIMDMPLDEVIRSTSVSDEISEALLTRFGKRGELLSLIIAYESGGWDTASQIADKYVISMDTITTLYIEAIEWTRMMK